MSEQDKRYLQEIEKHGAQREVLLTLLFGHRMLLRTLFRQEGIRVQLSKPLVSCQPDQVCEFRVWRPYP